MAIEKRERKTGDVYRVTWRDDRGRQRSRTFSLKRDASAYEAKIKLAKRQGELAALDAGKQTLDDFLAEWWRMHAEPRLAPQTLRSYARLRDKHVAPALGHLPLRSITTERIQQLQADMLQSGVGKETVRRTLAMLQGVLERAAEWGRIGTNPARYVKKPRQGRTRAVEALAPASVERLRAYLLANDQLRDATLVSVLAYAGLRPGEALALRWGDVKQRTLVVEKALSLGEERPTKTRAIRTVRLLKPLAADLKAWRLASGRPAETALVFPTPAGGPWTEFDYRNWRRRRYRAAATAVGLTTTRPYDLRHSFASLLFAEQANAAEIAAQLGHSTQVLLSTYLHVIEELRGKGKVNAEKQIQTARRKSATKNVAQLLPKPVSTSHTSRLASVKSSR